MVTLHIQNLDIVSAFWVIFCVKSIFCFPCKTDNTSRRRLSPVLESSKSNEAVQEDHRSRESATRVHGYQEMWHMICRLTVSELEESNSVYRKALKFGDLEGSITEDIASIILDQLLEETITTLSLTSQV